MKWDMEVRTLNLSEPMTGRGKASVRRRLPPVWPGAMVLLLAMAINGCEPSTARKIWEASRLPPEVDHSELELVELASTVFAESDSFASPWEILPLGDVIVVTDRPWLNKAVHILSAEDGSRLTTFGHEGQGPGEYTSYPEPLVCPRSGPGQFWLYDPSMRRLTQVDLNSAEGTEFDRRQIVSVPVEEFPRHVGFVSDSLLVVLGYFDGGRVALWDRSGDSVTTVGPIPQSASGIPAVVLQEAYEGPLAIRPDGRAYTVGTERGSRIDLFSSDDGWAGLAHVPFQWEPDFTVESRGKNLFPQEGHRNRSAYVDLAATSDRIFALFSGRLEFRFPGEMDLAEYVHEFDWQGRFIRAFHLDRAVEHIAVDMNEHRILATVLTPEPAIVSFSLPVDPDSLASSEMGRALHMDEVDGGGSQPDRGE